MSGKKLEDCEKLLAILGPTSSGKSALAIEMAKRWNGEIISADSRQVYRGMDIGTGKVTQEEQSHTRHWLLDVTDPNDDYNISHFLRDAKVAIADISHRAKLPILCGGTGFWIQALIENQELPNIPPDPMLREELSQKTPEELFKMLTQLDPKRANTIDRKNPRRLVRAIEIARFKEQVRQLAEMSKEHHANKNSESQISPPTTDYQQLQTTPFPVPCSLFPAHCSLLLALCPPKDILDATIKARLEARFDEGMIDEVRRLHETHGVSWERFESFGLEYRWVARFLRGLVSESEMFERLFYDIIHYAKRQMTWIRRWQRQNPNLHIVETPEEAMKLAENFLKK